MRVVRSLAAQLHARLSFESHALGLIVRVMAPLAAEAAPVAAK